MVYFLVSLVFLFQKVFGERDKSVENVGCEKHYADAAVNT